MITDVIICSNGMVMVFDEHGEQMPDYQGEVNDVLPRILSVFHGRIETACWMCGAHSEREQEQHTS